MPEAVVTALVQFGMLGPIVVLLAYYIVRRDQRHDAFIDATRVELASVRLELAGVNEKRVADTLVLAERLLSSGEKNSDALSELAGAIREQRVLLERIAPPPRS